MQGETGSAGPQGIMGMRGAGGPGVMLLLHVWVLTLHVGCIIQEFIIVG